MKEGGENIYKAPKCEYTGLPIFTERCDCFIHRKQYNTYTEPLKKSNSYEILQIEPPVTEDDLKKAYHKMCLKFHPDKKGGDAEKFIKIKNAYDELLLCC